MTASNPGIVSTSVIAGPITPTHLPARHDIGKGFNMGENLHFHFTPDVAAQWITQLTTIAKDNNA